MKPVPWPCAHPLVSVALVTAASPERQSFSLGADKAKLINLMQRHVQKSVQNSNFLLKPSALISTAALLPRAPPPPALCSQLPRPPTLSPLSQGPGSPSPVWKAFCSFPPLSVLNCSAPRSLISAFPLLSFRSRLSITLFHLLVFISFLAWNRRISKSFSSLLVHEGLA